MKKSILALAAIAALGATGAATAQSSVTVYGRMDLSLGNDKDNLANTSATQIESGRLTASRLGFRGTEDLGNGLKALFQLELEVEAASGEGFADLARQSWLGLSGGFGTVKLGRTDTAYKDIRDLSVSSSVFDSDFTPTGDVDGVGVFDDPESRGSNMIRYDTPTFNGFSATVTHSFDGLASPVDKSVTSFNLRYKLDKLSLGLARQEDNDNAVATRDLTFTALGATSPRI